MKTKPKTKKSKWPKLPVAFKRKWVKALRSGEYRQGEGSLLSPEGTFCCMGVAADMCGIRRENIERYGYIHASLDRNRVIPECLYQGHDSGLSAKLSCLNDWNYWSFRRIATWIEKNL